MVIKNLPVDERPRERALNKGIENLSTSELLAIILRTGSKKYSAIETATQIIAKLNSPSDLNFLSIQELMSIDGIGKTKAITILACLELGKRLNEVKRQEVMFNKASEVFNFMYAELKLLKEEHLYVLYLNSKGKLIEKKLLTKGSLNQTIMDSKLIFKWAYKLTASAFIIVHNHPSGECYPSIQDTSATKLLAQQAKTLDLLFLDHIIIGNNYYSFRENTKIIE